MADPLAFGLQDGYARMRNLPWSSKEKAIARTAFDTALRKELESVIRDTKKMAGKIEEPSQLWQLKHYLTERRKEIDRKYDYRYSRLLVVFGALVRGGASMRRS